MAVGSYGTIRPADVSVDDVDIFYNFTPNRETENNNMYRLDPSDVLQPIGLPEGDGMFIGDSDNLLEGLFNLRLPADSFSEIGIYTLYIKPKTHILEIADCSVLSSLPTVRGLVVDLNDLPEKLQENNAMQGYRIEYLDSDNQKIPNIARFVVTSNKVVPVNENVGTTSQTSTRYSFDDNGDSMFLQVTPSSSSDVKPNKTPFIGNPGQIIKVSNTYFSPVVLEIDMVENTIETLTNVLLGEQIKDIKHGILTYYDNDREISHQYNLYKIKDDVTDVPLFEVKEKRENIDVAQDFDDVTGDVD